MEGPGLGAARQVACLLERALKLKDLVWLPERDIARNRNWYAQRESPYATDSKTTSVKSAARKSRTRGPTILCIDVLLGQPSDTSQSTSLAPQVKQRVFHSGETLAQ